MKKTFDAVALKRRGAEKIHAETALMTPKQQLAFWQQRTEALRKRQQAARSKRRAA